MIAAAYEVGIGLTFAVAANTIKALCIIKRDLIQARVPGHWIGFRHSKTSAELAAELTHEGIPAAAMADTGDDDRPIMLV